jgi:hypothetical protein
MSDNYTLGEDFDAFERRQGKLRAAVETSIAISRADLVAMLALFRDRPTAVE